MSRLARALEARLEPVYRAHGLEPGWHDLLATLRRQGPPFKLRPTDLTGSVMLTSSGTTKRLDKLEDAGLITREPDPNDRRGTLIALTEQGPGADRRRHRPRTSPTRRGCSQALTRRGARAARRAPAQAQPRLATALKNV